MEDCVSRVAELLDAGIHIKTLEGRVDTKGLGRMAKLVVGILAAAAEIERELISERTQEGIREARAKVVPFGPKRKWSAEEQALVQQLRAEGKSYGSISRVTGKTISTIRRMLSVAVTPPRGNTDRFTDPPSFSD